MDEYRKRLTHFLCMFHEFVELGVVRRMDTANVDEVYKLAVAQHRIPNNARIFEKLAAICSGVCLKRAFNEVMQDGWDSEDQIKLAQTVRSKASRPGMHLATRVLAKMYPKLAFGESLHELDDWD